MTALIFSLIVHPVILTFLGVPISAAEFAGAATIGIFLFALYTVSSCRDITNLALSRAGCSCTSRLQGF